MGLSPFPAQSFLAICLLLLSENGVTTVTKQQAKRKEINWQMLCTSFSLQSSDVHLYLESSALIPS
jgi:hypothetical protein